ncbi:MAG: hypothetical protein ABJE66_35850, partial [Deltaproteobacteria bacterium]
MTALDENNDSESDDQEPHVATGVGALHLVSDEEALRIFDGLLGSGVAWASPLMQYRTTSTFQEDWKVEVGNWLERGRRLGYLDQLLRNLVPQQQAAGQRDAGDPVHPVHRNVTQQLAQAMATHYFVGTYDDRRDDVTGVSGLLAEANRSRARNARRVHRLGADAVQASSRAGHATSAGSATRTDVAPTRVRCDRSDAGWRVGHHIPAQPRARDVLYLYLVEDVWSRMIIGWAVHDRESDDYSAALIERIRRETPGRDLTGWVLHSDNGNPMKGATMLATLQRLGVISSFSRPSVSDDNAYAESLFRTMKYSAEYPSTGFASVEDASQWVAGFVAWY